MHVVYLCIALSTATTLTTMTSDHAPQVESKTHTLGDDCYLKRDEKIFPKSINPTNGFITPKRTVTGYTYYMQSILLRVVHCNISHGNKQTVWHTGYNQDRHGEKQEKELGKPQNLKDAERWFSYYDMFWKYLENNKQIPQDWK